MLAISNLAIKLAGGRSGWLFLVTLAAAVALAIYSYRAHLERRGELRKGLIGAMLALRAGVLVILVLFLFKPVLSFELRAAPRPTLAVLVDRSRSMGTFDIEGLPDRFSRSANALASSGGGTLKLLGQDFKVRLFVFDGTVRELKHEDELLREKPEGDQTDIFAALRGALEVCRANREDVGGVLLFSDGIQTVAGEEIPSSLEVPIHAICVGEPHVSSGTFRDIAISAVKVPNSNPVRTPVKVRVLVGAHGFAGRTVPVRLLQGEQELARTELTLDGLPGEQEVALSFTPTQTGQHECRAEIAPDPSENVRWNNSRTFFVNVTDPKIKVLYLEGAVRPEFRFLRRLLERDQVLEPLCLIKVRTGIFKRLGEVSDAQLSDFPRTREELEPFHVFIIGDLDSTHFADGQLADIARAVRERGRGLLMLQGANSFGAGGYGATPIAPLLPARLGGRDEPVLTGEFRMRLTREGMSHPIFRDCAEDFAGKTIAPFQVMNVLARLDSPDAIVLAEKDEKAGAGPPPPIVVAGRAGSGRVVVFAAGPTWPWALGQESAQRSLHAKFWGQVIRFLAGEKEEKTGPEVSVWLDRGEAIYKPGEQVTVYARVRGSSDAEVDSTIDPQGEHMRLSPSPGREGVYEATFAPRSTGRHTVSVTARARGQGGELGSASVRFEVEPPARESERLDPDEKTLRTITEISGGTFAPLERLGETVSALRSRQSQKRKAVVLELWNPVPLFFMLVAMAGSEWYLRRRMQLA